VEVRRHLRNLSSLFPATNSPTIAAHLNLFHCAGLGSEAGCSAPPDAGVRRATGRLKTRPVVARSALLVERLFPQEGTAAPKRVGIIEWDSLEKAEAFYKSKAWTDLAPQGDKAVKTVRRYVVEATN
jgi:Domain of unknown function (DUF1330)